MENISQTEILINEVSESYPEKETLVKLLSLDGKEAADVLFKEAYAAKGKYVGKKVYFRGLIEFSNICEKNCYYCGIRRDNKQAHRYQMTEEEAVEAGLWAYESKYGSIVLQAGERTDRAHIDRVERIVQKLMEKSEGKLGITLSLGEQSKETYARWFKAGAKRYLLRIETSSKELYKQLHPPDHVFEERLRCLYDLKDLGYQSGTGVMIGLPGQTAAHLADDLLFFKEYNVDMIGMGPYLQHNQTPLATAFDDFETVKIRNFELTLKMIALARIMLKDVNIAATTAMQAIKPFGREAALLAGANVMMPNITEKKYRGDYKLYENKPCSDEDYDECASCLEGRIKAIGETVGYGEHGDPLHYFRRRG
jgi:biotin synthase